LHVDQAKASIANEVKTAVADIVSSSMSCLSSEINNLRSSLSAPSNSVRSTTKSAPEIPPPQPEDHLTLKRTNSWLSQDGVHPRYSQFTRLPHGPRVDCHKKPRLDNVFPTGFPKIARRSSHAANPAKENSLDLRKSPSADGLTSQTSVSMTNGNNCSAASRTRRTPLADIPLAAPVNHVNAQFRNSTVESSPHAGGHLLPFTRAQMAIPAPPMGMPIFPSTAAESDNSAPPTTDREDRKIMRESVPPVTPQPVSKVIKLEEVLRPPLKCYISVSTSPLSSLSPSPSPLLASQPILKTQTQHAAGRMTRRQVTFATSSHSVSSGPEILPVPLSYSASASMSLRDRRAQMSVVSIVYLSFSRTVGLTNTSKLGRTTSSVKRFLVVGSSDEEG